MRILHLFFFLSVLIFLSACSQDPWKAEQIQAQAEADKTRIEAEQFALNQGLERQQSEQMHSVILANEQLKYERALAVEAEKRAAWQRFYFYTSIVGVACVVFALFMVTRATVSAYQEAAQGVAKAITQAADIRSRLIYLDDGRQFPAIVNAHMITDITTGATTDTTRPNVANPQLATGAIANRHVGVVAKETRRAGKDVADSVPLSQSPPIIDAKFSDVREYFEMVTQARKASADE